jgi:hypothetical protein
VDSKKGSRITVNESDTVVAHSTTTAATADPIRDAQLSLSSFDSDDPTSGTTISYKMLDDLIAENDPTSDTHTNSDSKEWKRASDTGSDSETSIPSTTSLRTGRAQRIRKLVQQNNPLFIKRQRHIMQEKDTPLNSKSDFSEDKPQTTTVEHGTYTTTRSIPEDVTPLHRRTTSLSLAVNKENKKRLREINSTDQNGDDECKGARTDADKPGRALQLDNTVCLRNDQSMENPAPILSGNTSMPSKKQKIHIRSPLMGNTSSYQA